MIPLKLSVQGLYSYQDTQEIDFTRLTSSAIFGIFGKVGSGKTSLIEAISFVLYDKTERLNDRGDNRHYNMMNLQSKTSRIDFEFRAGDEGQRYRFVYEAKRNLRKYHEVTNSERRAFKWTGEQWQPISNDKENVGVLAEAILGLDYDNFKRTIIIPQNQFREFLELTPGKRNEMMNRLFKLEQYDLSKRVAKLERANDLELAELRGWLGPLDLVTEEAIRDAEANERQVAEQLIQKSEALLTEEATETQLLTLQQQVRRRDEAQVRHTHTLARQTDIDQKIKELDLFERCQRFFQADLAQLAQESDKLNRLTLAEQVAHKQRADAEATMPLAQQRADEAHRNYESHALLTQQNNELDTVREIVTVEQSISLQKKLWQRIDEQRIVQKTRVDKLVQETDGIKARLHILTEHPNQLNTLLAVKDWLTTLGTLQGEANKREAELLKLTNETETIKTRKATALVNFPKLQAFDLKQLPEAIQEGIDKLRLDQQQRETRYLDASLREQLRQYRGELTGHKPCPLCGSVHYDEPHTNEDEPETNGVSTALDALNQVRDRLTAATDLTLVVVTLRTELRTVLIRQKELLQTDVVERLAAHRDAFCWPAFAHYDEPSIKRTIQEENNRQIQLADTQTRLNSTNEAVGQANEQMNANLMQQQEIRTILAGLDGQLRTASSTLKVYSSEEITTWTFQQLDAKREHLEAQLLAIVTATEEAAQRLQKARDALLEARKDADYATQNHQTARQEYETLHDSIITKLAQHSLTETTVRATLDNQLDTGAVRQLIQNYTLDLEGVVREIKNLNEIIGTQIFDVAELATATDRVQATRAEKEGLSKAVGKAETELATLIRQWAAKQQHLQQYKTLTLRETDLDNMAGLFRGQGFVNYVSTVYLRNLCESANERFVRLTNNQLRLELDEANNFLVRDYLNGGEVRLAKTLSGGQLFQAALSLALALSDNIQHLTRAKQNLFFLDEGFGTLDKESLETVLQTLKMLRHENRIVGLISHVDELQLEIDTYIRTELTSEGSKVRCSWEMV